MREFKEWLHEINAQDAAQFIKECKNGIDGEFKYLVDRLQVGHDPMGSFGRLKQMVNAHLDQLGYYLGGHKNV